MDVGVRELKKHLSSYLDRAANGQIIRVTERGQPKAILGPISADDPLQKGIKEKWIRPGAATPIAHVRRSKSKRNTLSVLRQDRDS